MIRSPPHAISPQPPLIRRAAPADVPAIVAIEHEAFADPWDAGIFTEAISYYPTTYFVAEVEGKIAGFIVGALEDTGENIYGHICNFAVTAPFRNRGIGRQLVLRLEHQFALELASGSQLEVRESNAPAQRFYRRLGYQNVFYVGGYYANGEDAIVMMKWFRF
ncbi:ribosomal protein S18-alanine N-acetyltransferase [Methanoregula sp.]|uniref:ribosomal protein S18-alanine N-acetyltransferase n=1 Tax=Methanoregula sp. TaxID=2052170 RepID=UPI002B55A81B|nr:ribosomal protein S18-alanine N-acetyltransferase [Methanoregula sp.]HVP96465.1 ribosomal protein S18-alanine N-acetyltransferase [Methanoregula sp.]